MKSDAVQRVVGIDWSGRVDAAGQRRHIWAGVWTEDVRGKASVRLEAGTDARGGCGVVDRDGEGDAADGGGVRFLLQLSGLVCAR